MTLCRDRLRPNTNRAPRSLDESKAAWRDWYVGVTGTPRFAHFACVVHESPCAENNSFALAGSIPTEFGKLMNLQTLDLSDNGLTGTHPFAYSALFGTRVYHLL
jgi:hypothetical protein